MNQYSFYFQPFPVNNEPQPVVNIESYFKGCYYLTCTGLNDYGKPKNIYTESFSETDMLSVYIPETVVRENTDITFDFAFFGSTRLTVFHQFVKYVTGKKLTYWDTCRNRKVDLVLLDDVVVPEEMLYGSEPYIQGRFKFKNINGQSRPA